MIKHIVLWNINEGVEYETLVQLKKEIEKIGQELPEVESLTYYIDKLPTSTADVMLVSTHKSFEDLQKYLQNPIHKNFSAKNKQYVTNRKGFDFEY